MVYTESGLAPLLEDTQSVEVHILLSQVQDGTGPVQIESQNTSKLWVQLGGLYIGLFFSTICPLFLSIQLFLYSEETKICRFYCVAGTTSFTKFPRLK